MPMLFEILEQIQREKRDTGLRKAYYALGNFVESLGKKIYTSVLDLQLAVKNLFLFYYSCYKFVANF